MIKSKAIGIIPRMPIFFGRMISAPIPVNARQGMSINETLPKTTAINEVLFEASVVNDIMCDARKTKAVSVLTDSVRLLTSAF